MDYDLLTQEEMDDMLTNTLRAQQLDHYSHTVNAARYEDMLATLPEGPWKVRIKELHAETKTRIAEVESIANAVAKQMPPKARRDASLARIMAAQEAAVARSNRA